MGVVKRRTGGAWATAAVKKRASGVWVNATATVRSGGSWNIGPSPVSYFDWHEGSGNTTASQVGGFVLTKADGPYWNNTGGTNGAWQGPVGPSAVATNWTVAFDVTLNSPTGGWAWIGHSLDTDSKPWFYIDNNGSVGNGTAFTGANALVVGTRSLLVFTIDGSQIKAYVGGVLKGTFTAAAADSINMSNFIVAGGGAFTLFTARFWNVTLTAAQVSALSGAPPPPPPAVPTITSIVPNPGAAGQVTVNGTGFVTGATVSFGGTAATNVTVVSATQLTCTAPIHADGPVNVTVTTSGGVSNSIVFTYQAPPPPPPSGAFPTAATTGVPSGINLTTYTGNYTATAGQLVTGLHITGDLNIAGANVIVRNCAIDGVCFNEQPNLLMEDCDIGPATTGLYCPPGRHMGYHDYTLRRCHLRGSSEGPAIFFGGGPVVIEDCFVELKDSQDGNHADCIQGVQGGNNARLIHNTFDASGGGSFINSGIFWSDSSGNGLTVQNNLWKGGGYVIRIHDGTGHTFTGNKVVQGAWQWGPVFSNCAAINWSNNELVTIDANYNVTSVVGPLACNSTG